MVDNWTQQKWTYLKKYLHAYTTIVSCHFPEFYYVDLFSGIGNYNGIYGSPLIALDLQFPFTHYAFVEKDLNKFNLLQQNTHQFSNIRASIFRNKDHEKSVGVSIDFKNMEAKNYILNHLNSIPNRPSFILLDPYGIEELDMDSVIECSKKKKSELLINFSVMGILRNISMERCHPTLTKYYGNDEWKKIPKRAVNRKELYAELYIKSLKNYFSNITAHVIRNNNNAPLYYLIHTTNNDNAFKIMKDVMKEKEKQIRLDMITNLTH